VHIDGTARVQIVDEPEGANCYRDLLMAVKSETGAGALLNTSFNVGEPLVETPGDAIATFLRSRLDALLLDEFVCWRK
jgi:carbamoyltransferase